MESSKDKLRKICDLLRRETLQPAKQEAAAIIAAAREESAEIVNRAEKQATELSRIADERISKEEKRSQVAIEQGIHQALEHLRQSIEEELFSPALHELIAEHLYEPEGFASLLNSSIDQLIREGHHGDIVVTIGNHLPTQKINALLTNTVINRLKQQKVHLKDIEGAEITVADSSFRLEINAQGIRDLLWRFLRTDLRNILFKEQE